MKQNAVDSALAQAGLTPDQALAVLMYAARRSHDEIASILGLGVIWSRRLMTKHKTLIKQLVLSDPTATDLLARIARAVAVRIGYEAIRQTDCAKLSQSPPDLGQFLRAISTMGNLAGGPGLILRDAPDKAAPAPTVSATELQSALEDGPEAEET